LTTPDEFTRFISTYNPVVIETASALRAVITETLPDLTEMVDIPSKIVAYGFSSTYAGLVCAIAPYWQHVNLMFARGVNLPDPETLLQGSGKRARHVRLNSPADVRRQGIIDLLMAAVEIHSK